MSAPRPPSAATHALIRRVPPKPERSVMVFTEADRYRVGDVIRYGYSADTARDGTVTEVGPYNHVKVDTAPGVIPPGWIIGIVTVADEPGRWWDVCRPCWAADQIPPRRKRSP